jgi:hypothetical protein
MLKYRKLAFGALVLLGQIFASPLLAQKGGGASPAQQQGGAQGAQAGGTPYFEAVMEAYGAVNELSEAVAGQVCDNFKDKKDGVTVIIFDPTSFQNVVAWQAFSSTATALKSSYETLLTEREVKALFPPDQSGGTNELASIPITSATDLAGLITALSSSTTNTASTFAISDSTMAVSLAHQFKRSKDCKVALKYYPLFGSYVNLTTTDPLVQKELAGLNKIRQYLQHTRTYTAPNSVAYALLADLNTQYDALIKSISSGGAQGSQAPAAPASGPPSAGPQSGPPSGNQGSGSGLLSLEQGAALNALLAEDATYVLYADVVAAGGTQRDRKNLITLITGDWITYSGGVIVNVALVHSKDTELILSDTLRYRTQLAHFSAPKERKQIENTNAGENEPSVCSQEKRLHWWQWRKAIKNPCPPLIINPPPNVK